MELHFLRSSFLSLSVLISFLRASSPVSALHECDFPAIFNFGDSNSDTGGLSAAFGQAPPPNGETYFHTPSGRYSDGRLVIDFIAESFGLPYLSAYLDAVGSNFTHGANFATAGSTVRPANTSFPQFGFSPISGDVQYTQYSEFLTRSQIARRRGGVFKKLLPKEDYFARALYTVDIGQNDVTAGYFVNMSTEEVKAYVPDVVDQLSTIIKYIYGQGGRSFWIHNTGPFGCLPYMLEQRHLITAAQIDSVGCARPFNEVAQYFNLKLKEAVVQLRRDLPLAALTYVDIYSIKYSLISQARKHGFEHPLRACCGYGGKYNYSRDVLCGGMITVNGTQLLASSCKDPSIMVNWDGIHFTEAANKFVFDQIVGGSYSDPPIPLKMACHKHDH